MTKKSLAKTRLNTQQRRVAKFGTGPIFVVAGAGTGKTTTIAHRVGQLLKTKVDPRSILLLTFTRKAAAEMIRAVREIDVRGRLVKAGTIHSLCLGLLREYAREAGLPGTFTIMDAEDVTTLMSEAIWATSSSVKPTEVWNDAGRVWGFLSCARNRLERLARTAARGYPGQHVPVKWLKKVKIKYRKLKASHNYLDFDDILVRTRDLLNRNKQVRDAVQARYRYIMIDEYQDTTPLQVDILHLIADHPMMPANVMAVGDPWQSIYGWRGASVAGTSEFEEHWPGARVLSLGGSYRSTPEILHLANALATVSEGLPVNSLTSARGEHGSKPTLKRFKDPEKEAQWICDRIAEHERQGTPLGHQAVLVRTMAEARSVEAELRRRRIAYKKPPATSSKAGGHIKDVLAVLRLALNPADHLSFKRLMSLCRGVGSTKTSAIWEALSRSGSRKLSKGLKQAIKGRPRDLKSILKAVKCAEKKNEDLGKRVADVGQAIRPLLVRHKPYKANSKARLKDLERLALRAEDHERASDLVAAISLEGLESIRDEAEASERRHAVTLSTIHAAKGLEWEVVFLPDLIDGSLPSRYAAPGSEAYEEERRILYVGITRAKRYLHLTRPAKKFGKRTNLSPFIDAPGVKTALK